MICPLQREETADVLLDYSARRLDAARTLTLEQHMENCPDCALFRNEQAVVWDALDAWEPMPVSVDFNRRLWQRIDAAATACWYTRLADALRLANWKPAFPLAVAILLIAGGFLLDHPADKVAAPDVSTQGASIQDVSLTEADQLEQTLDDIQMLHQLDSVTAPAGGNSKRM